MKIFGFDVESNGLHGTPFAVGAVVYDTGEHRELARFDGWVDIEYMEPVDPWVNKNVLPFIRDLHFYGGNVPRLRDLRSDFWDFLQTWKRQNVLFLVDVGWPVEARFLSDCIQDDPQGREMNGPYPVHELSTLLLAAGVDPDVNRIAFSGAGETGMRKHNPLDDAFIACHCAMKALRVMQEAAWTRYQMGPKPTPK